jgi:hypothetical protein
MASSFRVKKTVERAGSGDAGSAAAHAQHAQKKIIRLKKMRDTRCDYSGCIAQCQRHCRVESRLAKSKRNFKPRICTDETPMTVRLYVSVE